MTIILGKLQQNISDKKYINTHRFRIAIEKHRTEDVFNYDICIIANTKSANQAQK